ncbi:MAG: 16S rRNA (guanine(527)-N(7))-methyltransferase RsmG [Candidatus Aquirickettsiella gammari]|uniref:Ribosomal RNA small subunit methyltransferase G n=1 Tax=Candidatus Aquirickettsiella gammari TaxID=2016198 RepID=A0A370CH57_9COXI|nr:MAG: 16S rRNA (guanine(527)-N(7))-methyltransferase RsmG [Candidatus Aquirickettsiella gammari]
MVDFKQLYTELLNQLTLNHLSVNELTAKKLVEYLLLLHKWNQIHNLTSVRNPINMVSRHIIDSLTIAPYLQGPHLIDIGTGAGLPGIPLALTQPQYHFVLLDSNGKKTRFLTHVLQTLAISNAEVIASRVEKYQPTVCFNSLVSRAFSHLNDFLIKTKHLCCEKGTFLAMKGQYPGEEIKQLNSQFKLIETKSLQIAGLDEKRHLLIIGLNR